MKKSERKNIRQWIGVYSGVDGTAVTLSQIFMGRELRKIATPYERTRNDKTQGQAFRQEANPPR